MLVGVLAATQVVAHHGAGVFEPEKKVTVAGTVTDFQFVNPHVLVYMTVKGDEAKRSNGAASSRARTGSRATPAR